MKQGNDKDTETLSWDDLEKLYGISIDRPTEENQTILHGKGKSAPQTSESISYKTKGPSEVSTRSSDLEKAEQDRRSDDADVKGPMGLPPYKEPSKKPHSIDDLKNVGEGKGTIISAQMEVKMFKRKANSSSLYRNTNRLSAARQGIIWAELMMPPLSKRKRR